METGLTKQGIVSLLAKSPHGALDEYVPVARQALEMDGAFYQHLIAWNRTKGHIRDSKAALPVLGLAYEKDAELRDNSFAHLALLNPRELLKAYMFARKIRPQGQMLPLDRMVQTYLREKEQARGWDHLAVQHREALKLLYTYSRARTTDRVSAVLFGDKKVDGKRVRLELPKGTVIEAVDQLKNMPDEVAAASIAKFRIPFLIASERLGQKRMKNPDLLLALINRMTPTELIANTRTLEKLGMKTNPALRGAFDMAVSKSAGSNENILRATAAINAEDDDGNAVLTESTREKLRGLQDKQIEKSGIEGNWLVLSDKSGSMERAIEAARHISATLAKYVKGKVWLVFFDTSPMAIDVSGCTLDQIQKDTRHVTANGGTSIGCGLNRALAERIEIDGIVIVSDGEENQPPYFADTYKRYMQFVNKDVPVYFFECERHIGQPSFVDSVRRMGIEMQVFDVRGTDYYALPTMVETLRSNAYSLIDEIMNAPLLALNDVLKTHGKGLVAA